MKKENQCRILALLVLVGAFFLLEATKQILPAQDFLQKEEASRQAEACYQAIYQEKLDRGLSMDPGADINKTGMIGLDYSFITTTIGNLEAKRTSTNPNMAAVVVDMLQELKLQPGDKVAVNCSGSFPALNIAVMCAVGEMELDPFLITSFGSSTHGANDPEFTYLDMERRTDTRNRRLPRSLEGSVLPGVRSKQECRCHMAKPHELWLCSTRWVLQRRGLGWSHPWLGTPDARIRPRDPADGSPLQVGLGSKVGWLSRRKVSRGLDSD